jgi:polysaccharide pyruvyl transferase WcaK-like protein
MIAPESPGAIKAALARLDLIVTGRMHAAILAMGGGTPAFSFAYQDKFEGLLTLFGLQSADLLSTPEDLIANPAAVAAKALAHLDNAPALRAQIEAHLPAVAALAEQNFE